MTLGSRKSDVPPFGDDPEADRQKRRFALILLIAQVVALLVVFIVTGAEDFPVVAWLLLPGAFGIFGAIQVLRHPERVGRLQSDHEFDGIIAEGGLDLATLIPDTSQGGARLALQDALDAVRQQRGTRRMRVGGHVAAIVGAAGWLTGSIASLVMGEAAATGICVVAAAGFASLELYLARRGRRLRSAECILERQIETLASRSSIALPASDGFGRGIRPE